MPRIKVEIAWDWPTEPCWLNEDNVALALHAYCKHTKFEVRQLSNEESEYLVHCVDCRCTDKLTMIAHRVQGKMIGWLFVCENCWPTMSKAILLETTKDDSWGEFEKLFVAERELKR